MEELNKYEVLYHGCKEDFRVTLHVSVSMYSGNQLQLKFGFMYSTTLFFWVAA